MMVCWLMENYTKELDMGRKTSSFLQIIVQTVDALKANFTLTIVTLKNVQFVNISFSLVIVTRIKIWPISN
jgi:hypothetical protein